MLQEFVLSLSLPQNTVGADFEAAVQRLKQICVLFLERIEPLQTKEDFRNLLDGMPDPSFTEELMLLGIVRTFPHRDRTVTTGVCPCQRRGVLREHRGRR